MGTLSAIRKNFSNGENKKEPREKIIITKSTRVTQFTDADYSREFDAAWSRLEAESASSKADASEFTDSEFAAWWELHSKVFAARRANQIHAFRERLRELVESTLKTFQRITTDRERRIAETEI